jgi:glycosyltransferase involved in cell wall biosynthesis
MKILFIAPLSPPVTGQSLASDVLFNSWREMHDVMLVNLSKTSFKSGVNSFIRLIEVTWLLRKVLSAVGASDVIYFTISESRFGIAKDFLIYILCFFKLKKMVIHLHGGAGMLMVMKKKYSLLCMLNTFFMRRMGAVIILGVRHSSVYKKIVNQSSIHFVPNFALDEFFVQPYEVKNKFLDVATIKILFLSNLIAGKGHIELFEAYCLLNSEERGLIAIDFAGGFESEKSKAEFLNMIADHCRVTYHGVVSGQEKRNLFYSAHVFCLPTYYAYEGQPISILEAYASGCAVITTDHSGIGDIFSDGVNGYEVLPKSPESIVSRMRQLMREKSKIQDYALYNSALAKESFRSEQYVHRVSTIIENL